MRRAFILCLFVLTNMFLSVNAAPYFPPLKPVGEAISADSGANNLADPFLSQTYNQNQDSSVNYPRLNQIENSMYGRIFANQDILLRIARIEKSMFNTTYPNLPISQRVDNIVSNFNQLNQYPNISKNMLNKMEAKVFNKSYSENDIESRIEGLEEQIFGAAQGGDINSRYENLKTAFNSYKPNQYLSDSYQNPPVRTQGGWRGVVGNLGSMLLGGGGFMTGFTPPLDPLNSQYTNGYGNNYNNNYGNNYNNGNGYNNYASLGGNSPGYGLYSGNRTNHGYSDLYKSYGTGSRVTILD